MNQDEIHPGIKAAIASDLPEQALAKLRDPAQIEWLNDDGRSPETVRGIMRARYGDMRVDVAIILIIEPIATFENTNDLIDLTPPA